MKFIKIAMIMYLIILQNNCISSNQNDIPIKNLNITYNISCNTPIQEQIQYLQNQINSLSNDFYKNKKRYIYERENCREARRMICTRLNNRCKNELIFEEKLNVLNEKVDLIYKILFGHINKKQKNSKQFSKKRDIERNIKEN